MADKIKEKAPIRKELKEKVKAAPKELLRRGLDDGTERLRSQFRDTAQHGQRDGYGGDQIEDAAWRGSRWGERGIEKLLKKKKTDRSKHRGTGPTMPPEAPTEPPSSDSIHSGPPKYPAPADGAERVRIKTREAITNRNRGITPSQDTSRGSIPVPEPEQPQIKMRETAVRDIHRGVRPVSPDRTGPPQIRTRESVFSEPPASVRPVMRNELERPQIKTREYIAHESSASAHPIVKSEQQPRIRTRERIAHEPSGSVQPLTQSGPDRPHRIAGDVGVSASLNRTEVAVSPNRNKPAKQLAVKSRETRVQMPPTAVPERSSQAMEQGRRKFQREQKEKAVAKRFGQRRTAPEAPPLSPARGDKPSVQRSSPWRQIARGGDAPVMTKGRAASPAASSGKAAVKAPGASKKAVGRKAGQTVKTAKQGTKQALRSLDGVKAVGNTAQTASSAYKRAAQAFRATKKPAAVTVRGAAKAGAAALRATVRAARTLAAALAAGGSVVVSVILVLCLVGALVASPFGIFFAGSDSSPDVTAPSAAVAQINGELSDYLAALQAGGTYDRTEILGQPPSWANVFAVFAAKTAAAADGVDVATLDTARVDLLRAVFWDMTKITAEEETVNHPASGSTPAWSETVLKITITPRTPDDMRVFYSFTDGQNKALDSLLSNGGMLASLAGNLTISSQDAKALLAALPPDLDPERRAVVETACQLVGKVNHFWGGKSRVLGWDERWGQIRKVTASGSSTSGTYRPFGLDCSGFVDWVFYNVTGGSYIIGHGGGAHSQHGYCTAITWDQAIPGDLVFYPGDTHVGIVGGRDESGNLLIIHCTYSKNNVVITDKSGFTSIARPNYYSE